MTFADPHLEQHLAAHRGDYAGRRRYIDGHDIAWIMARKREGLSDQNIAAMGRFALIDVQKVCSEHLPGVGGQRRATYDSSRRTASIGFNCRPSYLGPAPAAYRVQFGARLVMHPSIARAVVLRMPTPKKPWKTFVREVAHRHGLTLDDLVGPARSRKISGPRQEAMWVLHQQKRWSLPTIGEFLGGRDHTTILHGVRRHAKRLAETTAPRVAAE
jgi:hypothetical protein